MENIASFWNFLRETPENTLITNYSWLSCQFLLGNAIWTAAQQTGAAIGKSPCLSRVTALPKALVSANSPPALQNDTFITYQSAIALKLSPQWNEPVDSLAEQLILHLKQVIGSRDGTLQNQEPFGPSQDSCSNVNHLNVRHLIARHLHTRHLTAKGLNGQTWQQTCDAFAGQLVEAMGPTITVSAQPKGYIQLHLSERTMTVWLDAMQQWAGLCFPKILPPSSALASPLKSPLAQADPCGPFSSGQVLSSDGRSPTPPPISDKSNKSKQISSFSIADIPFDVIYAHARSCSLLRLAHGSQLITLQSNSDQVRTSYPSAVNLSDHPSPPTREHSTSKVDSIPSPPHPPWVIMSPTHFKWGLILKAEQNGRGVTDESYSHALIFLEQIVSSLDQYVYLTVVASPAEKRLHQRLLDAVLALSHGIQRFDAHIPLLTVRPISTQHRSSALMDERPPAQVTNSLSTLGSHQPCRNSPDQVEVHRTYLGLLLVAEGLLRDLILKLLPAHSYDPESLDTF